jgi:hypothetical protein
MWNEPRYSTRRLVMLFWGAGYLGRIHLRDALRFSPGRIVHRRSVPPMLSKLNGRARAIGHALRDARKPAPEGGDFVDAKIRVPCGVCYGRSKPARHTAEIRPARLHRHRLPVRSCPASFAQRTTISKPSTSSHSHPSVANRTADTKPILRTRARMR